MTYSCFACSLRVNLLRSDGLLSQSQPAVLIVQFKPTITEQPNAFVSVDPGSSHVFTVAAEATPSPAFQWLKDGAELDGETQPTLAINNVTSLDAAVYTVRVSNSIGERVSEDAVLRINEAPQILWQPTEVVGDPGEALDITLVTTGTPFPTFSWFKDGALLQETHSNLVIFDANQQDEGQYTVVVSNRIATITSENITVRVNDPPVIEAQPNATVIAIPGQRLELMVVASGSPAPSYSWMVGLTRQLGSNRCIGW